jgi:hypothetical protein
LFTRGKALIKSDNIKKKNPNLIQIGMDPWCYDYDVMKIRLLTGYKKIQLKK